MTDDEFTLDELHFMKFEIGQAKGQFEYRDMPDYAELRKEVYARIERKIKKLED